MIRLLQLLFLGHIHKWKIIRTTQIYDEPDDELPYGTRYDLQCEHCGKITIKKTYGGI